MKLRSLIIALAAVGAAAFQASAQVTLVSQQRYVSSNGCPPAGQFFSAPDFGPFGSSATIFCPNGHNGVASQNSSLSPALFSLDHSATAAGAVGTDSYFRVEFDVVDPVSYSMAASSTHPNARVQFSGPGINVDFTNSSLNDSGTLAPGRYTVTSTVFNLASGMARATIDLAFSSIPFTIPWSTIDGGGGRTSGGPFTINGTIGQWDAGQLLAGGSFTIVGGYWALPPACPGDVNGDRMVGLADVAEVTSCWAQPASCNLAADLDLSGSIGLADLAVVVNNWAASCPF